jgi:hypothetical protein
MVRNFCRQRCGRKMMKFEISFKADLTPEKKELLDLHFENTLKLMGIEPEALTITLREKPDFIPAVWPATFTGVPR